MSGLTRRALLARGAIAGAGLLAAGCGGGTPVGAPARTERVADALDFALEAERLSAFQLRALARELRGGPARLVRSLAEADTRHARALVAAGARMPKVSDARELPPLEDLPAALVGKERAAAEYLADLPELTVPATRTLVGFILAEEVAHAAALRDALGRDPVAGAFL